MTPRLHGKTSYCLVNRGLNLISCIFMLYKLNEMTNLYTKIDIKSHPIKIISGQKNWPEPSKLLQFRHGSKSCFEYQNEGEILDMMRSI